MSDGRPVRPWQPGRPLWDHVPVIDLARVNEPAGMATAVRQLQSACRASGAFVVVGHDIPQSTISAVQRAGERFFTQPAVVKRRVGADPRDPLWRGFTQDTRWELFTANGLGEPQAWSEDIANRGRLATRNRWPELPGFRETCLRYYAAASALSLRIMRLCAVALGLDSHWFDDKFDRHMTPLILSRGRAAGCDGRAGGEPHPDFTALSVRCQDHTGGGLQVRRPGAGWTEVPYLPGSLLITLGRLMARWTNDCWTSPARRMVNPPASASGTDHVTAAFCYHPDPNAVIECIPTCLEPGLEPRHRPVVSAGYFIGTARRAMWPMAQMPGREQHGGHGSG